MKTHRITYALLVAFAVAAAPLAASAQGRIIRATKAQGKPAHVTSGAEVRETKSVVKQSCVKEKELAALDPADEKLIREMPLKNKVGQLLFLGFTGTTSDETLETLIPALKPGALVMFGRNIKNANQISELTRTAQTASMKASGLPLLIGVDQEGGNVIRLKTTYPLPSALAFGKSGDTALVERAGAATGKLMKTLGLNMNLAPVLDISDEKTGKFLGTRSYGEDPEVVAKMGAAFSRGMQTSMILPTTKHFPGHGGVEGDSHLAMPSKRISLKDLEKRDLVPFAELQRSSDRPWAVMLAHITYPELDPSGAPASFSKPIVTDLLRNKIGFNGVVITDDIQMAGAGLTTNVGERAVRAIEAGVDMVMITWNKKNQASVAKAIASAVKSGRISEERIDQSLRRIIAAKRAYAEVENKKPSSEQIRLTLKSEDFKTLADQTLQSAFNDTPTKTETEYIEYQKERPLIVFSANQRFTNEFKKSVSTRAVRGYALSTQQTFNIDRVMRSNPTATGVFYVSGQQIAKLAGKISEDVANRILLVTVEAPSIVPNIDDFRVVADVYYRHPDLGGFIAKRYFDGEGKIRTPASAKKGRRVSLDFKASH